MCYCVCVGGPGRSDWSVKGVPYKTNHPMEFSVGCLFYVCATSSQVDPKLYENAAHFVGFELE